MKIAIRTLSLATVAAGALFVGCSGAKDGPARGRVLYDGCTACHGDDGRGNKEVGAPPIAGLPQWYVEAQLDKFRQGLRGTHPGDIAGLRMRPMVMPLRTDDDFRNVAAYVAGLPKIPQKPTLTGGDADNGETLFGACIACHGATGEGNEVFKAPSINQLPDWYLATQLRNFRNGIRGTNPDDLTGVQMRAIALTLTEEQGIKDVVAHISTLAGSEGN